MSSLSLKLKRLEGEASYSLAPEWIRIPQACAFTGLGRSTIFTLINSGAIASKLIKTSKHNVSGCRVVSVESLRALIEESEEA